MRFGQLEIAGQFINDHVCVLRALAVSPRHNVNRPPSALPRAFVCIPVRDARSGRIVICKTECPDGSNMCTCHVPESANMVCIYALKIRGTWQNRRRHRRVIYDYCADRNDAARHMHICA